MWPESMQIESEKDSKLVHSTRNENENSLLPPYDEHATFEIVDRSYRWMYLRLTHDDLSFGSKRPETKQKIK